MRRQPSLRAARAMGAGALGVAILATGASAVAQATDTGTATTGGASPEQRAGVHAKVVSRTVRTDVLRGRAALVRGVLEPAGPGRTVVLQARRGGRWTALDRDRTDGRGGYTLRYRTARTGAWPLRVLFRGDGRHAAASHALGHLKVYRAAAASWYGPGLYGAHLACGGTLTPGTLGVANKSLPCGTKVTLRYRGRTVRVPVVDRGPYAGNREFDLTAATKARLGFGGTGTVWTTR